MIEVVSAIPTPEQPDVSAGKRNRWHKGRAKEPNGALVESVQENVPPTPPAPIPSAAPQLTEAQEIAQRTASESPGNGETTFAALSREQKIAVLIAAGELGLSSRAFTNAQKNLYPLLNAGDAERKIPALSDEAFFKAYTKRRLRIRWPFSGELDWDAAAISGEGMEAVIAVRRDSAGGLHRYPFLMTKAAVTTVYRPGGVAESDIEVAVLSGTPLTTLGVLVLSGAGEAL
jgi:hypothetical protein